VKTSEFKAIEKRLTAHLPGLNYKDRLLFLAPVQSVLKGFYFEPSGFGTNAFYLWVFFQPLFVPAKEISFLFGRRLENGRRWRNEERDLEWELLSRISSEIPKLMGLNNAETVASEMGTFTQPNAVGYVNPHCREALAYALIQAGQVAKADRLLGALLQSISPRVAWEQEIASRAIRIREMLPNRPTDAAAQLVAWEYESAQNLELTAFLEQRGASESQN
jgi:hypothetical protein